MISLKFIENGVYHKLNVSIENLRNGDGTTIPSAKTEFTDSVSDVPASNIYTDKIWYRVIKYEKKNSKTNAINVTAIHCIFLRMFLGMQLMLPPVRRKLFLYS